MKYFFFIIIAIFSTIAVGGNLKSKQSIHKDANKTILSIKGFYLGMSADSCLKLINDKYNAELIGGYLTLTTEGDWIYGKGPKEFVDPKYYSNSLKDFPPPRDYSSIFKSNVVPKPDSIFDEIHFYEMEHAKYIIRTFYWKNAFYLNVDHNISLGDCQFNFDSENCLINFYFKGKIVNNLFNVSDMTIDNFAQTFISKYNIPKLDVVSNDEQTDSWYEYTSKDGWKLIIRQDKTIIFQAVPKEKERNFD